MTWKMEQHSDGECTIIRLIGHILAEHLEELRAHIQGSGPGLVVDLDQVTLVGVDVVRFLRACEAGGCTILHGPPYIREWMLREQNRQE